MKTGPPQLFWLNPSNVVSADTIVELSTALLALFYLPLYNYPLSLKEFLQRRSFMVIVLFATIYVSFQSIQKAALWSILFVLIDVFYRVVDERNAEAAANE